VIVLVQAGSDDDPFACKSAFAAPAEVTAIGDPPSPIRTPCAVNDVLPVPPYGTENEGVVQLMTVPSVEHTSPDVRVPKPPPVPSLTQEAPLQYCMTL
jgi:hypothetical protein